MRVERIDRVFVADGRRKLVRNLPAHVCGACGERFLDARAAAGVERALGMTRSRKRARSRAA